MLTTARENIGHHPRRNLSPGLLASLVLRMGLEGLAVSSSVEGAHEEKIGRVRPVSDVPPAVPSCDLRDSSGMTAGDRGSRLSTRVFARHAWLQSECDNVHELALIQS